ncbi:MAG TPA: YggT family protein [Syntrophorhabdaceae bacterium]|nr:YggT family protein [Syntrophorhabdaceae bacterium]HQM80702.1 YggT family protein [Syntrophorhabdaceae bacterium]
MTGIAHLLDILLEVYVWIIIARAVISWFRPSPYNPVVRAIYRLVDPVTYRISRIIPTRIGMVDMAPLILIVVIVFIRRFLIRALFDMGTRVG